jgi:hypothetical protein
MRKFPNILAVTLVALALCADRATASVSPSARPQIGQVTRQVVRQLTKRFQHVVPTPKLVQDRREGLARVTAPRLPSDVPVGLHATESTPFRFRLPPPAV